MTTFSQCAHCKCNKEDTTIYKCSKCETAYCDVCADKGWIEYKCPECHSGVKEKLGYVKH